MCTYKPHRIVHNSIGTSQALTALPLLAACIFVLANSQEGPASGLDTAETRRLALGVAAACVWSAVTVVWAPSFTSAVVRTMDPVIYPLTLRLCATASHLGLAGVCLAAWRRAGGTVRTLIDGIARAPWDLGPPAHGAEGSSGGDVAVCATLSLAFLALTSIALAAPFPLATVPSLLGKRCARAFGAWTLLAAVALQTLKAMVSRLANANSPGSATEVGAAGGGSVSSAVGVLRLGLRAMSVAHLGIMLARPLVETVSVYPAAMACLPATLMSVLVYVAVAVCV